MASFLDKFRLQTAKKPVNKFDLSCRHMTTANFMRLQPVYYRHLIPNQQIDIDVLSQVRMESMPVPTYGDCRLNVRGFYVPYSLIFKAWDDFVTDTVHTYSDQTNGNIPQGVPYCDYRSLMRALINPAAVDTRMVRNLYSGIATTQADYLEWKQVLDQSVEDGNIEQYDFILRSDTDIRPAGATTGHNVFAIQWTDRGRAVYKFLTALGYTICTDTSQASTTADSNINLLPLLAFTKIYVDWYYPTAYYQSPERVELESLCNRDVNADDGTFVYDEIDLFKIFKAVLQVSYDADYFVSAFDNPVGPNNGAASSIEVKDPSIQSYGESEIYSGIAQTLSEGAEFSANTPIITPSGATPTDNFLGGFSQFALDSLRALTNYMTRHRLAGARALDRLVARFGGAPLSETLKRSVYLGSATANLMVRDVMSNAATDGATLGDYAGKGLMFDDNGHFSYKTKEGEYGMLILCASVIPSIGYYQGFDRHNLRTDRLQWYTPEFDGMGTEAIVRGELYDDLTAKFAGEDDWIHGVFGFTPRYAIDKVPRDFVTGDFRVPSKSKVGSVSDSWHLMREFNEDSWTSASQMVHSREFSVGSDADQYLRIFNNTRSNADHFIINFAFRVTSFAPMLPLYEQYDFHEDNGEKVIMQSNGVKMN